MNANEAIRFVRKHGVVLASGKGPVPRLTEAIVGKPIKGSWWAHPQSRRIFAVLRAVEGSDDILVCRLVNGKVTFVHRRLWPALVRVAERLPAGRISEVQEEHTESGRHIAREIPFPEWVPPDVIELAKKMSEKEAIAALGDWAAREM